MLRDLINWDPFDEFFNFGSFLTAKQPPIDVYQTDTHLVAELHVPNLDINKLNVSVSDGVLRVEGVDKKETEEVRKNYFRHEVRTGSFIRTVILPAKIDEGSSVATYKDGVLKISFEKKEVKVPKKILVTVE